MRCNYFTVTFLMFSVFSIAQNELNRHGTISKETNSNSELFNDVFIELAKLEDNGIEIPISIKYSSSGTEPNAIPNSIGFDWELVVGGKVHQKIRQINDFAINGRLTTQNYLYNTGDSDFDNAVYGTIGMDYDESLGEFKVDTLDIVPDIFYINTADGIQSDFFYKSPTEPKIYVNKSAKERSVSVNKNLLTSYSRDSSFDSPYDNNQYDFKFYDKSGLVYKFRRSVKKRNTFDLIGYVPVRNNRHHFYHYDTFLLDEIENNINGSEVTFEYTEPIQLNKLSPYGEYLRVRGNQNPQTPPDPNIDHWSTAAAINDYSVEDVSRKEIKTILSNKYEVEFHYTTIHQYLGNFSQNQTQRFNNDNPIYRLEKISIRDRDGDFIKGFSFQYGPFAQSQGECDYSFQLRQVNTIGSNGISEKMFKTFDYYSPCKPGYWKIRETDAFGFYAHYSSPQNIEYRNTPVVFDQADTHKMPDLDKAQSGLLKSIEDPLGLKTDYQYQLNLYNGIYYGGLLLKEVKVFDSENGLLTYVEREYSDPEGFGIPMYNSNITLDYPLGYIDDGQSSNWHELFTSTLVNDRVDDPQALPYLREYWASSRPYALYQNTPQIDNCNGGYCNSYNTLRHGVQYMKVKETHHDSQLDEIAFVKEYSYEPYSRDGQTISKFLKRISQFGKNLNLLNRSSYNYELLYHEDYVDYYITTRNSNSTPSSGNNYYQFGGTNNYSYNLIRGAHIELVDLKLLDVIQESFDSNENLIRQVSNEYSYLHDNTPEVDVNRPVGITTKINGENSTRKVIKYFNEDADLSSFVQTNWGGFYLDNPVIAKTNLVYEDQEWLVNNYSFYDFTGTSGYGTLNAEYNLLDQEDDDSISYSSFNGIDYNVDGSLNIPSNLTFSRSKYYYNNDNRLIRVENNISGSNLYLLYSNRWDPLKATVNSFVNGAQILIENFESDSYTYFEQAYSGNYVMSATTKNFGSFPSESLVSYWWFNGSEWYFKLYNHSNGDVVITPPTNALYIDEVIIRPKRSTVTSTATDDSYRVLTEFDEFGKGLRREYDVYGKQRYLYDENRNLIQENIIKTLNN